MTVEVKQNTKMEQKDHINIFSHFQHNYILSYVYKLYDTLNSLRNRLLFTATNTAKKLVVYLIKVTTAAKCLGGNNMLVVIVIVIVGITLQSCVTL